MRTTVLSLAAAAGLMFGTTAACLAQNGAQDSAPGQRMQDKDKGSCRRSERAMQASWLQRAAPPHPIATGMKRASTRAHRPPAAGHDLLQAQSCTEWNIRIGGALSQLEVA